MGSIEEANIGRQMTPAAARQQRHLQLECPDGHAPRTRATFDGEPAAQRADAAAARLPDTVIRLPVRRRQMTPARLEDPDGPRSAGWHKRSRLTSASRRRRACRASRAGTGASKNARCRLDSRCSQDSSSAPLIARAASRAPPRPRPRSRNSPSTTALNVVVVPDHRTPVVTHMLWYRSARPTSRRASRASRISSSI